MKKPKSSPVSAAPPDPRKAGVLEEVDFLRLKLAIREVELAEQARNAVTTAIMQKYRGEGESKFAIGPEGKIERS